MSQEELPSLIELAQLALDMGFVPIPLVGKRPIIPQWQRITVRTALRKIEDAVRTGSADNIGILTGAPSGVIVVDVDVTKGGLEYWNDLITANPIEETFTVETGSGGLHYYFVYDETTAILRNATKAIRDKGIDIKTTGGQVVFVGSIHPETGRVYTIVDGVYVDAETGQESVTFAPMPSWLFDLLRTNQTQLDVRYPRKYRRK